MLSGAKHLPFEFRQAEIQNLRLLTPGNENVGRLDVAMRDAFVVRHLQPVCDLNRETKQFVDWDGCITHPLTRPDKVGIPSPRGRGQTL